MSEKPKKNHCGGYYCDYCGDCMVCYGDLDCRDGGFHVAPEGAELEAFLPKELHACSTGDCPHEKQEECDKQLAEDYPSQEPIGKESQ